MGKYVGYIRVHGRRHRHVVALLFTDVPAMFEDLVEKLSGLQLGAELGRNCLNGRFVHIHDPLVCHDFQGHVRLARDGAIRLDVVHHASGLQFFNVEAGQAHHLARVVSGIHNLRLDGNRRAAYVGGHRQFANLESEIVQSANASIDPPALAELEGFLTRQFVPQFLVACKESIANGNRVEFRIKNPAGLEIHQFANNVRASNVDIIMALALRKIVLKLARLRVHKIGGKFAGVAPKQSIRQRDVSPEKAEQM